MTGERSARFGPLLRRHRLAAGLSQEELAEAAGLSRRGISDLERGVRRVPQPATLRRLAEALHLTETARADFVDARESQPSTFAVQQPKVLESVIPTPVSSFVGRRTELDQVRQLLGTTRLLTLTGAGGVGKTRLAIEIARGLMEQSQSVGMVDLAAIAECSAVASATAAALGLPLESARPPIDTLRYALRREHLLLILDNCEQVLQGCAELADSLLSACLDVKILATSRENLGIFGETTWRVPSLVVPCEPTSVEDLLACDGTRLFLERAMALAPDAALSGQNAAAVARICRRLDGIPLAIELAAAQISALSVEQIAERLDDALRLLVRGNRASLPRQRTLRATIAWGYALLDPSEKLLLDRLSVFAGGWTLEAAEQVCADREITQATLGFGAPDVVGLLTGLVAKSLVVAAPDGTGGIRYRMLETLRQYARERLADRGEADALSDRHADFFVTWLPRFTSTSDTSFSLPDGSIELDNLRTALRWLLDRRDAHRALQLGASLRWYWFKHGWLFEGAQWCAEILALPARGPDTEDYAHVVAAAALLAARQGRVGDAQRLHTHVLALWRSLDNKLELARSLSQLGYLNRHSGRSAAARECFQEGVGISRDHEFRQTEALNRIGLAETLYDLESVEAALVEAQRALAIQESFSSGPAVSWGKRAIGLVHYQRGEYALARRFLEDSLEAARGVPGRGWWLADALACVAQLDVDGYSFDRAGALLREALEVSTFLGDQRMIVRSVERVAYLTAAAGHYREAIRLNAAAIASRAAAGLPRAPVERHTIKRWLAPAEAVLRGDERERSRMEGVGMDLEQMVTAAMEAAEHELRR